MKAPAPGCTDFGFGDEQVRAAAIETRFRALLEIHTVIPRVVVSAGVIASVASQLPMADYSDIRLGGTCRRRRKLQPE